MNKHQDPESNRNKMPEQEAPKLPESIMPEIQTERDDVKGKVLYSSNLEEVGMDQSPTDAYRQATDNHLAAIADKDPNWLQKALITRNIANEREQLVKDDIQNRQDDQNRHADLLTGKQQKDWLKLQTTLEAERAELAIREAKSQKEKLTGIVKTFFTSLGSAIGSTPASVWYGWKEVKDDYKKRKHLN